MPPVPVRTLQSLAAMAVSSIAVLGAGGAGLAGAAPPAPAAGPASATLTVTPVLAGASLHHRYWPAGSSVADTEPLADPDDITLLGDDIFVGFQNGVGPQGQASTDGNLDSTVVEFTLNGTPSANGTWSARPTA